MAIYYFVLFKYDYFNNNNKILKNKNHVLFIMYQPTQLSLNVFSCTAHRLKLQMEGAPSKQRSKIIISLILNSI